MTRIYLTDGNPEERAALRLVLEELDMQVIGEAADWQTTIDDVPEMRLNVLLIDWGLLSAQPSNALETLRASCPAAIVVILISHLDARQQAALSAGADVFISKGETPEHVAERLHAVAQSFRA